MQDKICSKCIEKNLLRIIDISIRNSGHSLLLLPAAPAVLLNFRGSKFKAKEPRTKFLEVVTERESLSN